MLEIVTIGEYIVDFSRQMISKNGTPMNISKKISSARAWGFLELLVRANGRILSYNFLDDSGIWPDDSYFADHKSSYKSWVSEFNKTMGDCKIIKNISGVGYRLDTSNVNIAILRQPSSEQESKYSSDDTDSETLEENISQLNEQLDTLGINLDTILHQLDLLRSSKKDSVWEQLHGDDFDSMLMHFMYMKKIAEEKQKDLQRVKSSLRKRKGRSNMCYGSHRDSSPRFPISIPNSSTVLAQNEIDAITNFLSDRYGEITFICDSLVELLAQ